MHVLGEEDMNAVLPSSAGRDAAAAAGAAGIRGEADNHTAAADAAGIVPAASGAGTVPGSPVVLNAAVSPAKSAPASDSYQ
jgi:hypothetical protein